MRKLHSRLSTAVLVLAAATVFATGCGDDSGDTTTTAAGSSSVATTASADSLAAGEMAVSGLVDYPMTFTVLDMDYMQWVTVTAEHPETGATEYDGVLLSEVFSYVGLQTDATTLMLAGADGSSAEIALADIDLDQALLAVDENDVMSAVLPGSSAEAWVDNVKAMEFR